MTASQPTPERTVTKAFVCGLLLAILSAAGTRGQTEIERLVTIETGDLPIILSAPHGGSEPIPGVPERKGIGVKKFRSLSDQWTDGLTERLADALEKITGKRPYVVIARFHRKYLDANRPPALSYESDHPNASATYQTYHAALADARAEVTRRWGRGILFDIHGQAAEPDAIFRGTQNGKTVTHLIHRFGPDAQIGDSSAFGQFAKQGLRVIPASGSSDRETKYTGGHIVVTYGSGAGGTVDAIQLELGRDLRHPKADTANQLANAITQFAEKYLPKTELDPKPVRVGVYRDIGAGRSADDLLRALNAFDGVAVHNLMADDIRAGALSKIDVLIQPGGSGGKQGRHLREDGREKIREFLSSGGGYIGICAGSYLASADYEWSLDVLDAKVLDRKHWARGVGTVEIKLSDAGKQLLRTGKDQFEIHYAQGPLLAPAENPDIPDYQTAATFKTEIAKNGAPEGVMIGTTAIAKGQYGRGRVICFSPHPEMTDGLEKWLHYAIQYTCQNPSE